MKLGGKETLDDLDGQSGIKRERSGTIGSIPARKGKETPKKTVREKEVRRSSDDRRQKRGKIFNQLVAFVYTTYRAFLYIDR